MKKLVKSILKHAVPAIAAAGLLSLASCKPSGQVIIYTNADEEAIAAMQSALDGEGYEGKYFFQSFSTSELGGKLGAEGRNTESDLVTLSSYYIESTQAENGMFKSLGFDIPTMAPSPDYMAPITAQEGTLFYNTEVIERSGIPIPKSIRDLADPVYKGHISITNIRSSSTAWLLVQALVSAYGEDEAREILNRIVENAGDHFENAGSGPLKKVRAGEVAIGFGLRQQAVLDQQNGLPIAYIDPAEGNYMLQEAVALVDHGKDTKPEAAAIAEIIVKKSRPGIMKHYPVPLYKGEISPPGSVSRNVRQYPEPLTTSLLRHHESLMN